MEPRAGLLARQRGLPQLLRRADRGEVRRVRLVAGPHQPEDAEVERHRAARAAQARRAASVAQAVDGVREQHDRPVPRGLHERGDLGGVRRDGCVPTAHVPDSDEARYADARVVRVARRADDAAHHDPEVTAADVSSGRRSSARPGSVLAGSFARDGAASARVAPAERVARRQRREPGGCERAHPGAARDAGGDPVPELRAAARRGRSLSLARR